VKAHSASIDLFAVAGIAPSGRPAAVVTAPPPAPHPTPARSLDAHVPSPAELAQPAFSALCTAVRGWDIALPGQRGMHLAGATHIRLLLRALVAEDCLAGTAQAPGPLGLLRQVAALVQAGHLVLRTELGTLAQQEWQELRDMIARVAEGRHDA